MTNSILFRLAGVMAIILLITAGNLTYGYGSGVSGRTLKGPSPGCTCHTGSTNSAVSLTISGPTTLSTGQTGNYQVLMTYNSTISAGGMNIAASNGTLLNSDGMLKVVSGELTQPSARTGTTSLTWNFKYTAPAAAGIQTLYATGCAIKSVWNNASNFSVNVTGGATINLLTPVTGTNWTVGTVKNITWFSSSVTNVKLEYSTDNGSVWSTIVDSTPAAAAAYAWTVPNTPSTQCLIRISDASNASLNSVSNPFTIVYVPSAINVSATWPLTVDGTPLTVGNISAGTLDTSSASTNIKGFLGHTFFATSPAGLLLGATGPTNYPADGTGTTADNAFTGLSNGTTPRYVQFTISPAAGYNMKIDSLSFQACQNAVSGTMNVAAGYSTDGTNFITFNGNGRAGDPLSSTAGSFSTFGSSPSSLTIPDGGTLTVRIIIWRKASSTAAKTAVIIANAFISGYTTPVTSLGNEQLSAPKNFLLSQNYPNPFNPTTKIDYQVPVDAKVIMEVYNITGQKVSELVNQQQSAGYYTLDFGASTLSSGVYFYRMIAKDVVTGNISSSIRKMILLK